MGVEPPPKSAEHSLTLNQVLEFLDRACDRVGLDEDRKKMMRHIFIYGEPIAPGPMGGPQDLEPMPDVQTLLRALETAQTWFNARPGGSARLNADLMMCMSSAGFPVEVGVE